MTNLSTPNIVIAGLPRHGSPQDRGSADAYYGRPCKPHYFVGDTYKSPRIEEPFMTIAQIKEYLYGYENEDDSKDWGVSDWPPHAENHPHSEEA
jgi:hypothetical protein